MCPFEKACRFFLPFVGILLALGGPPALADTSTIETLKERHHIRANILRKQSKARAEGQLQRETVSANDNSYKRQVDFHTLGLEIQRLGALIQKLADPANADGTSSNTSGRSKKTGIETVFGPEGPTEKTVRIVLDYRLMVAGNPRLKTGLVKDAGEKILARVVTGDGSVVEEYAVDKKTGEWSSVRN